VKDLDCLGAWSELSGAVIPSPTTTTSTTTSTATTTTTATTAAAAGVGAGSGTPSSTVANTGSSTSSSSSSSIGIGSSGSVQEVLLDKVPTRPFLVLFHSITSATHQHDQDSPSFYNIAEISQVVQTCTSLIQSSEVHVTPQDIGVIGAFRAQVVTSLITDLRFLFDWIVMFFYSYITHIYMLHNALVCVSRC
jgi:hypothetical protein